MLKRTITLCTLLMMTVTTEAFPRKQIGDWTAADSLETNSHEAQIGATDNRLLIKCKENEFLLSISQEHLTTVSGPIVVRVYLYQSNEAFPKQQFDIQGQIGETFAETNESGKVIQHWGYVNAPLSHSQIELLSNNWGRMTFATPTSRPDNVITVQSIKSGDALKFIGSHCNGSVAD